MLILETTALEWLTYAIELNSSVLLSCAEWLNLKLNAGARVRSLYDPWSFERETAFY